MNQSSHEDAFAKEVHRLRADYERQRDSTNLVPPTGQRVIDQDIDVVDGNAIHTYWYEDGTSKGQCIRLADIPGTLSGDILRLRQDLPVLKGDHEIIGDQIRPLKHAPSPPPDLEDDSEDLGPILATLPIVDVDPNLHFVKKGKYESEIRNLLKCQGGSCPGTTKSTHVVRLLGKSSDGQLVFEKFTPRWFLAFVQPFAMYKSWILQLILGMQYLHSLDIVHRDLRIDNLVFSSDKDHSRLIICDLEGRWGNRLAPEVSREPILDAGWTKKSDIYDVSDVIKGMIYGNVPITNLVEWPVPSPFDVVVEACTREAPEERPSLSELYDMVSNLECNTTVG
ncbi:kinase-like domain-containing protein [Annulohypoxylon moriforme]|nr:kinase-like domain-containing protein [Annulohypoxylon moriforme]